MFDARVLISCLVLCYGASAAANPQCTHLGEDVICPDGVAEGSNSEMFTATGILWSDGTETFGTDVALFEACPIDDMEPAPGLPGDDMTGSNGSGGSGSGGGESMDIAHDVGEQLALTSDPASQETSALTGDFTDTHVIVDLVTTGADDLAREFGKSDPATRLRIREQLYLPTYVNDSPPAGSREAILQQYRESGDLAGAARALADGTISYDQTTTKTISNTAEKVTGSNSADANGAVSARISRQFIGLAQNDQVMYTTRGNCYEFVHLAAYFAGPGAGPVNTTTGVDALIDGATRETWDGSSNIPAGKIVIGAVWSNALQGGQDSYGFYHVGISLGNGLVVSNRGAGPQVETMDAVFGSNWYQNVYYGDYGGYKLPDDAREHLTGMSANFTHQIDAIATDDELDDAGKARETAKFQERQALVAYLLGDGPAVTNLSPDGKAFNDYLVHLTSGIRAGKPYFHTDYATYTAVHNPPPAPAPNTISRGPAPPAPPEGRETAILIADWFNISEAGNLGIPEQGQ